MILQWKPFEIDLALFNTFLKENVPSADGIVADHHKFEIIETIPFNEGEISLIQSHYDSLAPMVP